MSWHARPLLPKAKFLMTEKLNTTPVLPPRGGFNSPLRQIIANAVKRGRDSGTRLDEIAPEDLAWAETDATADAIEFAEIALADAGIGIDRASQRAAWTITTKRTVEAWLAGMGDGEAAERAEMRAYRFTRRVFDRLPAGASVEDFAELLRDREPAIGDEYAAKLARGVVGALSREPVPQRGQVPGMLTAPSPQAISRWRRALAMQASGLRLATADGVAVPTTAPSVAANDTPDLRALETWALETDRREISNALKRDRLGMVEIAGGSGFSLIDPADLAGLTLPARAWVLDEWIPKGTTTLFTGAAGVGKSLMAQQLATAVATGTPFVGLGVEQGVALYLTCEDDADELHRRQAAICETMGVPLDAFGHRLRLASLIDADMSLATFDRDNAMKPTQALARLRTTIVNAGTSFVVLDNVAHLFGGNEIVKAHVAAFIGMLNRLAAETGATILLVGHPNKAGAEYSGNVAWEAQVRARIFLDRIADDAGRVADPDARRLSRGKANYAAAGASVEFRWHKWAFVGDADLDADERGRVAANLVAKSEDAAFLRCLDAATTNRENVAHRPGSNYAPRIFAAMPEGKGYKPAAFERAMRRLVSAGTIGFDEPLWPGPNRHPKRGIARANGAPPLTL